MFFKLTLVSPKSTICAYNGNIVLLRVSPLSMEEPGSLHVTRGKKN